MITTGGHLWTFGQGDSNQLGQGDTSDSNIRVIPCEVENQFDGEPVVFCSISDGHMAAVTRDGSVWSWGRATFGRLGHEYAVLIVFYHRVTQPGIPEKVAIDGVHFVSVVVRSYVGESSSRSCPHPRSNRQGRGVRLGQQ